jgi:HlyD family secretion protein
MKKLLAALLLITIATTGCSFKNNLELKGDIQNNIVSAVSTVSGKIIEMHKKQGEPVKKGEIIAVVDNSNQKSAVLKLQAVVNMKKAKLEELEAGTRPEQIEQAKAQVRAAKAQLDLLLAGSRSEQIEQAKIGVSIAGESVASARETYEYNTTQYNHALELYDIGGLSQNELDSIRLKLNGAEHQLSLAKLQEKNAKEQLQLLQNGSTDQTIEAARANYDAANAQEALLQNGATKQTMDAARADLEQAEAQLAQAANNLNNCTIAALEDGIIISKNFELGDVVNIGSNIADIAVSGDLYVLCYIPDKYLDKIYYNQPLPIKTKDDTLTGAVSYIALQHEYTPKDKQSTSDSKHTATKVKVAFTDASGILKSGMTATVSVPLK